MANAMAAAPLKCLCLSSTASASCKSTSASSSSLRSSLWSNPLAVDFEGKKVVQAKRRDGVRGQAVESPTQPAADFETVQLGKSDVYVPRLGVGSWSWGDVFFWHEGGWDDRKAKEAKAAFEASVDSGLPLFDTAEVYGQKWGGGDDSETLLGRFIKERERAKPQQATKVVVATKFAALPWRFGRSSVVSAVKASLRRLGVSQIDLYQLHWPGLWGNEGFIDGLADAVELGLVKAVGVSNYKVLVLEPGTWNALAEWLRRVPAKYMGFPWRWRESESLMRRPTVAKPAEVPHTGFCPEKEQRLRDAYAQLAKRGVTLASNQVHYSLVYRNPEQNGVKRTCDELGVSLIAYSPLGQGVLTGKYSPTNLPSGARAKTYNEQFMIEIDPLVKRMKEIGQQYGGKTPTQVALNWLLAQGNVIPIPGAKSANQAQEFAGALGWGLSDSEVEELRSIAKRVKPVTGFPAEWI